MLKNALYHQFYNDLLSLYGRTKNSAIECVFLKFAGDINFSQWLRSYKKSILSKLSNPSVYDAIEILIGFGDTQLVGDSTKEKAVTLGPLFKMFQSSNKNLKTIPIIREFSKLVDNANFKEILFPFKNNILAISNWFREVPKTMTSQEKAAREEESKQIVSDLNVINNMFLTQDYEEKVHVKKPSLMHQRKDMFVYLLTRFSEEVAAAFENSGMHEIAQKFRSKILALSSLVGIGSFLQLKSLSYSQINSVKIMLDYVWKHSDIRWCNYNHDLMELTFLNQAGEISDEDFYSIKLENEKVKDIIGVADETDDPYKGIDAYNKISMDKKINPAYIQMLSLFFVYQQIKLKM